MGKASRWLKGLLGMKKQKDHRVDNPSTVVRDCKEKKRWSFGCKSGRNSGGSGHISVVPGIAPVSYSLWLRSYIDETEKDQTKHAIAVAAAASAAADAAVASARAASEVVKLRSRSSGRKTMFFGGREGWAAVKIQTVFRGYLARKALRALKGLVKLQALVRGYLIRKQTAATLHRMQVLVRAQAAARSQMAQRSLRKDNRFQPEIRPRKSIETLDEKRSEFHSKWLSANHESPYTGFDEIKEMDTAYKTRSRSRRFANALSEFGEDMPYPTVSSPLPCLVPGHSPIPDCQLHQDFEWYFTGDECKFSTAQSTPRFSKCIRYNAPGTPAKSVYGDSFFRPYSNSPNYMANTQSSMAKLRSLSAPKQRPEPGPKKQLTLNEIMAARNSISSVRMQRSSHSHVQESWNLVKIEPLC
ncbi:Protein IQ-DOMAIN like [Quillaja saponaria]|uniref:Protein IQ-DOMAIN like n=1 Tax=Quillaja saponaria TaxID=32244 RepID=A0AAD7PDM6_QUISA|nr:Protein IQ-DOMAIN like [Quillaja saponaria]